MLSIKTQNNQTNKNTQQHVVEIWAITPTERKKMQLKQKNERNKWDNIFCWRLLLKEASPLQHQLAGAGAPTQPSLCAVASTEDVFTPDWTYSLQSNPPPDCRATLKDCMEKKRKKWQFWLTNREAEAGERQETGLLKEGEGRVEKVRGGNHQIDWVQREDGTKCPKTGCGNREEMKKVRSGERRKNQEKLADVSQCS